MTQLSEYIVGKTIPKQIVINWCKLSVIDGEYGPGERERGGKENERSENFNPG